MVYHNTRQHAIEKIKHIWLVYIKEIILFFGFFFQVHPYPKIIKLKKSWKSIQPLISCETMYLHTKSHSMLLLTWNKCLKFQMSPGKSCWASDIAQPCCCKGRGALSQCLMPTPEEPSLFTMHRWKIKRRLMQLALVSENNSPQNSDKCPEIQILKTKHKGNNLDARNGTSALSL